jgi:hypothetical protein
MLDQKRVDGVLKHVDDLVATIIASQYLLKERDQRSIFLGTNKVGD